MEPLIATSTSAGIFDPITVRTTGNPEDLARIFKPEDKSFVLAARVTGNTATAFPDGPPKTEGTGRPESDRTGGHAGLRRRRAQPAEAILGPR